MRRLVWMVAAFSWGCADPCEPDEHEGNDTQEEAADLGPISDAGNEVGLQLTLHHQGDEDWFTFLVTDGGIDGNPEVRIKADGDAELELAVTFACSGDPTEFFSCSGSANGEEGCAARGTSPALGFAYDCEGSFFDSTDNGTVVLRVTRLDTPESCAAYDLEIFVD